jgi:hypothetical protein
MGVCQESVRDLEGFELRKILCSERNRKTLPPDCHFVRTSHINSRWIGELALVTTSQIFDGRQRHCHKVFHLAIPMIKLFNVMKISQIS